MSPEVEQPPPGGLAQDEALGSSTPDPTLDPGRPGVIATHPLRAEPAADRWRWRARIRQNVLQRRLYRGVVALVGTLLVVLGCVSGPLPGPGGIPLVLLGLAVWASEFVWAERLMALFKRQLVRFRSWSRLQQTLAWLIFFACCSLLGYAYLLLIGPPAWLPASVDAVLARLPGV